MKHWKSLLDPGQFLGPQDFPEPREVTISRVVREQMPTKEGEVLTSAPMLYILGKDGTEYARKLKMPKTVLFGMSVEHGNDVDKWVGKKITVYATTCLCFGIEEECLRIKFSQPTEQKIVGYCKKRKINPRVYKIT